LLNAVDFKDVVHNQFPTTYQTTKTVGAIYNVAKGMPYKKITTSIKKQYPKPLYAKDLKKFSVNPALADHQYDYQKHRLSIGRCCQKSTTNDCVKTTCNYPDKRLRLGEKPNLDSASLTLQIKKKEGPDDQFV
jgi:hypothetical protein